MEVNLFHRDSMHASLGFAQPAEHGARHNLRARGESGRLDQIQNVRKMAMLLWTVINVYAKFGRGDSLPLRLLDLISRTGTQALKGADQLVRGCAGIHQCTHGHVAANARKRVQVTDFHTRIAGSISAAGPRSE